MTTETTTSLPRPETGPSARVRASTEEREETVARLHHALGEGRLDLDETETRIAAAYAAQYRDELPALLADLPSSTASVGTAAPRWAELWALTVWRARTALLGPQDHPTPAQCRSAAWLVVLAVVWMALCAFTGAAVVG